MIVGPVVSFPVGLPWGVSAWLQFHRWLIPRGAFQGGACRRFIPWNARFIPWNFKHQVLRNLLLIRSPEAFFAVSCRAGPQWHHGLVAWRPQLKTLQTTYFILSSIISEGFGRRHATTIDLHHCLLHSKFAISRFLSHIFCVVFSQSYPAIYCKPPALPEMLSVMATSHCKLTNSSFPLSVFHLATEDTRPTWPWTFWLDLSLSWFCWTILAGFHWQLTCSQKNLSKDGLLLYIPDWWTFVDQVWTALELVLFLGTLQGFLQCWSASMRSGWKSQHLMASKSCSNNTPSTILTFSYIFIFLSWDV